MILDEIVSHKQVELAAVKEKTPLPEIRQRAAKTAPPRNLAAALRGKGMGIIAEVKKASPSRGVIRPDFDPVKIARAYAAGRAAAISVLTESRYFQGSLDYLLSIHKALGAKRPPLLRKDFIFDPYQVYEARAYGADALLLITAILTSQRLHELLSLSRRLGMECLVEVHDEAELEIALQGGAKIIGINNRDLRTFKTDINVTTRLRPLIPADKIVVSESGIGTREDIRAMQKLGVSAVLIGEALMSAPDIKRKLKELS
ncbi:MAG: indole-3-glycerol phosphate synthase TrpC [Dehalococcoidia bacterium]|nr:indole-3-glycerol phosphate synthase TrpC [Dehalococcoidia bacterium]MDD5493822.1 indole-3-glycerol phosphate synthase TrpC [Dehalococcoidia bacterium]